MNVENLNKLIAHLEAQPPERINMFHIDVEYHPECGTCGCIAGHARLLGSVGINEWLDISRSHGDNLIMPDGYGNERYGVRRYPAHRVIATLKRLRDTYLATGQVVVDWGPEPGEERKTPWTAPQAVEVIAPALPAEITGLLRPSPVKTEA